MHVSSYRLLYIFPVCSLTPPVPPVIVVTDFMTDLVMKAKFFAREFAKNTRDEWAH